MIEKMILTHHDDTKLSALRHRQTCLPARAETAGRTRAQNIQGCFQQSTCLSTDAHIESKHANIWCSIEGTSLDWPVNPIDMEFARLSVWNNTKGGLDAQWEQGQPLSDRLKLLQQYQMGYHHTQSDPGMSFPSCSSKQGGLDVQQE